MEMEEKKPGFTMIIQKGLKPESEGYEGNEGYEEEESEGACVCPKCGCKLKLEKAEE